MQECAENGLDIHYSVLLTGDHSTPVAFGDHSHEPVPLALAHVRDIASILGTDLMSGIQLGPLPLLTQHTKVWTVPSVMQ